MTLARWMPPASELERWDRRDHMRALNEAKKEYKRLARCLLAMIDDSPLAIRDDLPEELKPKFDTLARSLSLY